MGSPRSAVNEKKLSIVFGMYNRVMPKDLISGPFGGVIMFGSGRVYPNVVAMVPCFQMQICQVPGDISLFLQFKKNCLLQVFPPNF